jgi:hypothetical protein
MRMLSRIGMPAMGAAMLAAGLLAAAPAASASSPFTLDIQFTAPSNCTGTVGPPVVDVSLTCTHAVATQKWQVVVICEPLNGFSGRDLFGNVVTGNGTSSVECPSNTVLVDGRYSTVS